ncbi:hypothetical protein D3C80_1644150 [compost metagenome]
MIQLMADGYHFFAADNTVAHLYSKQVGQLCYTRIITALRQHTDGFQCIVDEMRVDLVL